MAAAGAMCVDVDVVCAQAIFDRRPVLIPDPQPQRFSVCYGHTCSMATTVALSEAEWDQVRAIFQTDADGPEGERERVARAIGLLEDLVGQKTGTSRDLGGDVRGFLKFGQMDCVDEATNTTAYLTMLARDGLLRWHRVEASVKRGHIVFGVPHATALITDTTTGEQWAVDSWYLDNGEPPYIVPYAIWKEGWDPPPQPR